MFRKILLWLLLAFALHSFSAAALAQEACDR